MPAFAAPALGLRDGEPERLTGWARSSTSRAGLSQTARIVLLAADGASNTAQTDGSGCPSGGHGQFLKITHNRLLVAR